MRTIAIDIRLIGQNRTGDESVFRNLFREVLAIDRDNRYLLLTDRDDEKTFHVIIEALGMNGRLPDNAEVVTLHSGSRYTWNFVYLPIFFLRRKVDIFHTQYILPAFIPRRTKVVTHIHDVSFCAFPDFIGKSDRIFLSTFIPRTMRKSDLIIAPSDFTKAEIVRRYGKSAEQIAVVPNAVDPSFLTDPTIVDMERAALRNGLPESFVLSVGTMQPRKNIPLLVKAFAEIRKDFPDLSLVLIGSKGGRHYDTGIDEMIRETGIVDAVVFPGYVPQEDMPAVYGLSKMLVFPSLYEGFGIPLLEGFAAGAPVAASDIPPFREVGGEAVLYFDPTNVASCVESLYTLLTDANTRERCGRSGKERLVRYSWAESARALISCYESITSLKS
ncbi:MAG: glycosyltransferase family 4 protein [Candidatus Moranbacteria bacterium]|nr:glycosyltransferase family 4 protein [Candidatus Moranbacteria bacterium]